MKDLFDRAFALTMKFSAIMLGVSAGLCALRFGLNVAGFLLGSALGTLIFIVIMYKLFEHIWNKYKIFD